MNHTISSLQDTILNLENTRYAALLRQDYETVEHLCHPDLVYGHTAGNRDSLQTYLTKLRNGILRYSTIDYSIESVVLLGETALVLGEMNAHLTLNGTPKTLHNTYLAVWTQTKGIWKFVAYQPTARPGIQGTPV
ncbi:protein of unknown function [Arthrobacter sp. cf158]|uniref:nuclear transport factor 2 family protein n=1 Tax=Arthrobacter sp. cf158 TaxID=1761744 RepID=UPI00089B573D|nr:nuclear transport factor 2 family protein [Arthrobacter sp. cf158]SDW98480.1 protein of unknown function [Arthrobacter sp. cf158]